MASHESFGNLQPKLWAKKGRESNWQFDSRPLKVGNRPVPDVRSGSATWRWKDLDESYKIGLDLVLIGGRGEELWSSKVTGLQPGHIRDNFGTPFREPRKNSHSDVVPAGERRVYYKEYGDGISRVRAVVCHVSPS
jgi:hypothetical protein